MLITTECAARALHAYRLKFMARNGWSLNDFVTPWLLADTAFRQNSLPDFERLYEILAGRWYLFRPNPVPAPNTVWNLLSQIDPQLYELRLSDLELRHLPLIWHAVELLAPLKRNQSGPSLVAITKLLHFRNPRLFLIIDDEVMWRWVCPHDWIWASIEEANNDFEADPEFSLAGDDYECDIGWYPSILLWASRVTRANPHLAQMFAECVRTRSQAACGMQALNDYQAVALEWVLCGAAHLPPAGVTR